MNSGYFSLNGIGGLIVAVVLLLAVVGILGTIAVSVQKEQANNHYTIEGSKANMIDKSNSKLYKLEK